MPIKLKSQIYLALITTMTFWLFVPIYFANAQTTLASQGILEAGELTLDRPQTGKLDRSKTQPNLRFNFKSDKDQTLEVSLVSKDFDTILTARNENRGALDLNDDFGSGTDSQIRIAVKKDQTLILEVSSFSGEGDFELTAKRYVPLSLRSVVLAQRQPQPILFEPPTRNIPRFNNYSVMLESGQSVRVEVQSLNQRDSSFDPILEIGREVEGDFVELARDDDSGGGLNPKLIYRSTERGKHYLRVSDTDAREVLGYTLTYSILGEENPRGTRPLLLSQEDSVSDAATIGELNKDQREFQTDLQFERFLLKTPSANRRVSFTLSNWIRPDIQTIGSEQFPILRVTSVNSAGQVGGTSLILRPWRLAGGKASYGGIFPLIGDYWVDVVAPDSMKIAQEALTFSLSAVLLPNSRTGGVKITELRLGESSNGRLSGESPFIEETARSRASLAGLNFGTRANSNSMRVFRAFEYFTLAVTAGKALEIAATSTEFDTMLDAGGLTPLGFASVEKNDDEFRSSTNSILRITPSVSGSLAIRVSSSRGGGLGDFQLLAKETLPTSTQ